MEPPLPGGRVVSRQSLPARLAQRLARLSAAERRAAEAHERARAELARELAAAADDGYSLRTLAPSVDRSTTATHRLVQDGASA